MDVLGFPLEALFLSHCYSTTVRSFWAWVALLLTAALSFWQITAVGSRHRRKSDGSPPPPSFQDQTQPPTEAEGPQNAPLTQSMAVSPAVCSVSDEYGFRKGVKFAAYFCGDDDRVAAGEEYGGVYGDCDAGDGGVAGGWPFDVGAPALQLAVVRRGDLGWYRCQDLTALDGSVVRLWDGERRRMTPLRRNWAGSPGRHIA